MLVMLWHALLPCWLAEAEPAVSAIIQQQQQLRHVQLTEPPAEGNQLLPEQYACLRSDCMQHW